MQLPASRRRCTDLGSSSLSCVCAGRFARQVTGRITKSPLTLAAVGSVASFWDLEAGSSIQGGCFSALQFFFITSKNTSCVEKTYTYRWLMRFAWTSDALRQTIIVQRAVKTLRAEPQTLSMYVFYFFPPTTIETICGFKGGSYE